MAMYKSRMLFLKPSSLIDLVLGAPKGQHTLAFNASQYHTPPLFLSLPLEDHTSPTLPSCPKSSYTISKVLGAFKAWNPP